MNNKREMLKKVASVSAVVALAPTSWTKPVLSSVLLPAHAQTSSQFPTFTQSVYNTGVTVADATNAPQNIIDLKTVSFPGANNGMIFWGITSATYPSAAEESLWDGRVQINSGVLQVVGLFSANPNESGEVSITVGTSDGKFLGDEAVFNFNFSNRR